MIMIFSFIMAVRLRNEMFIKQTDNFPKTLYEVNEIENPQ